MLIFTGMLFYPFWTQQSKSFGEVRVTTEPPPPYRILQGGGVPGPGIAFRFLNLIPGDSDSANCLGQTITSGKGWRRAPPPQ